MQFNRVFLPEVVLFVCLICSSALGPGTEAFLFGCSVTARFFSLLLLPNSLFAILYSMEVLSRPG